MSEVERDYRREDAAIDHVRAVLAELDRRPGTVMNHPDREGVAGGCDAILQRGSTQVAVEHTRVYTVPMTPGHVRNLRTIAPKIEPAVHETFPAARILVICPVDDLPTGKNWETLAEKITEAAIGVLPTIPDGEGRRILVEGEGLEVVVFRRPHSRGPVYCRVLRGAPNDDERRAQIRNDMCRALADKRKTLSAYRQRGFTTMLILDAEEVGWPGQFVQAFEDASKVERIDEFDDVYLVGTASMPLTLWPLKLSGQAVREFADWRDLNDAEERANAALLAGLGLSPDSHWTT